MTDTYQHKGQRRQLIEQLRAQRIASEAVLDAMAQLPRHWFIHDTVFVTQAYEDRALPIGVEQTISQPSTVAIQSTLLGDIKRQRVLEVGTGSGYQAAILSLLGARVFSLERQPQLFYRTQQLLDELPNMRVRCFLRDGYQGLPEWAPFDKILVTAGAEKTPPALLEQLKIGGQLVIPVGDEVQQMKRITRTGDTTYETEEFGGFRFVPFVEGLGG